MWLINRLLAQPQAPSDTSATPPALPDAPMRRLSLKRSARVGRAGMAPWQKVAHTGRSRTH